MYGLVNSGLDRVLKKIGEAEVIITRQNGNPTELLNGSARFISFSAAYRAGSVNSRCC